MCKIIEDRSPKWLRRRNEVQALYYDGRADAE